LHILHCKNILFHRLAQYRVFYLLTNRYRYISLLILKNTEKEEVNNLYQFIFNRVKELDNKFQVIIVDHANLANEEFQDAIIEKWWDKKKLIPESWYK